MLYLSNVLYYYIIWCLLLKEQHLTHLRYDTWRKEIYRLIDILQDDLTQVDVMVGQIVYFPGPLHHWYYQNVEGLLISYNIRIGTLSITQLLTNSIKQNHV